MPRLPDHVIDEVRSRVDLVEVVSEYVTLQRSGRKFKGICPFHSEKTPSFYVDQERQLFYCFGCQAGGNVFNFLMQIDNAPFGDVVRRLADRVGLPVEDVEPSPEEARKRRARQAIYKANELATAFFVRQLFSARGSAAREYLKGRGLTKKSVRAFRIGYAPDDWHGLESYLKSKGVPAELAVHAGLLRQGSRGIYDWMRGRVTFPIADTRDRVVGFGGRILSGDGAKYVNTPESPLFSKRRQLYGVNIAKDSLSESKRVIVVEGYMDVVALYENGVKGAVASLGTAFTQEQAQLLRRYASEVVLAYDADAAGQAAVLKGLGILSQEGLSVRVARLPQGHDPDTFVRERGKESFEQLIDSALPLVEYKLQEALRGVDLGSVEGRMQGVDRVLPVLHTIESAVAQEGYIARTAQRLSVSTRALAAELERFAATRSGHSTSRHNLSRRRYTNRDLRSKRRPQGGRSSRGAERSNQEARLAIEKDLLRCIVYEPAKAANVAHHLGDAPFSLAPYNELFQWLLSQGDDETAGEAMSGRIQDPTLARIVSSLLMNGGRPAAALDVYLERVVEEKARGRVKDLEAKLSRLMQEERVNIAEISQLLIDYKRLRDRVRGGVGTSKVK